MEDRLNATNPGAQTEHSKEPSRSLYLPLSHSLHAMRPDLLANLPDRQSMHCGGSTSISKYDPRSQLRQVLAPAPSVKVPLEHGSQTC